MQRAGKLWKEIATQQNVEKAIMWVAGLMYDAAGKRVFHIYKTPTKKEIEIANNFDILADKVLQELQNRNYDFGKLHSFVIKEGRKQRQINHLDKHGEILLCSVMNVCQKHFINKYIPFTYSSIKGRGLVDCVKRVKKIIAKNPDYYYLQADAKHCYQSTKADVSLAAIKRVFKDKYVIEFFEKMLSLVDGLAIGFSPNHYIMNLVLSPLDHRMIEEGFASGYNRYMDDVLVICKDKDSCIKADRIIREEFAKLNLTVKENSRIAPVRTGIDYCGYVFYPTHTRLRKTIKQKMKRTAASLEISQVCDKFYRSKMASYHGWCKWGNCRNLEKLIFKNKLKLFSMEPKKLRDIKHKWYGMERDRFISTNLNTSSKLYDNDFVVLAIEQHSFKGVPGVVVKIEIDGDYYYTISKSQSLVDRFPRAWQEVGNAPFVARLKMQRSKTNPDCQYPILI